VAGPRYALPADRLTGDRGVNDEPQRFSAGLLCHKTYPKMARGQEEHKLFYHSNLRRSRLSDKLSRIRPATPHAATAWRSHIGAPDGLVCAPFRSRLADEWRRDDTTTVFKSVVVSSRVLAAAGTL
jgi:hypothetical protein